MKNILEKMVSPARLGWHGLIMLGIATYEIKSVNSMLDGVIAGVTAGAGVMMYRESLRAFFRTSENIRRRGTLEKDFLEAHMKWYCNRQGARTAASNYGFAKEFDKIMNNYNGEKKLSWIPHI